MQDFEIQETPTLRVIKSKENIERLKNIQSEIKTFERISRMLEIINDTKQEVFQTKQK